MTRRYNALRDEREDEGGSANRSACADVPARGRGPGSLASLHGPCRSSADAVSAARRTSARMCACAHPAPRCGVSAARVVQQGGRAPEVLGRDHAPRARGVDLDGRQRVRGHEAQDRAGVCAGVVQQVALLRRVQSVDAGPALPLPARACVRAARFFSWWPMTPAARANARQLPRAADDAVWGGLDRLCHGQRRADPRAVCRAAQGAWVPHADADEYDPRNLGRPRLWHGMARVHMRMRSTLRVTVHACVHTIYAHHTRTQRTHKTHAHDTHSPSHPSPERTCTSPCNANTQHKHTRTHTLSLTHAPCTADAHNLSVSHMHPTQSLCLSHCTLHQNDGDRRYPHREQSQALFLGPLYLFIC